MIKRVLFLTMILSVLCGFGCLASTGASEYDADENSGWCQIYIEIDAPSDFDDDLTVYLDCVPIRICRDNTNTMPYKVAAFCEPGVRTVSVISSSDIGGSYSFSYPDTFEASEGSRLNIMIRDRTDVEAAHDEIPSESLNSADHMTATVSETCSEAEHMNALSGYAQLSVRCSYYSAIKSVTYSLLGPELVDIELTRDNNFSAEVPLAPGSYKELALTKITLDDDASDNDYVFSFSHKYSDSYGNVYDLVPGEKTIIDDLIINMSIGDAATEADSRLLYAPRMLQNLSAVNDARMKEVMPETHVEDPETAPYVLPVADTAAGVHPLIIIAAILAVIGVIALILHIRRKL